MAPPKKQRSKRRSAQPANPSFRQSLKNLPTSPPDYDPDSAIDAHNKRIDYLTETEVTKLIAGAKHSRNPERDQGRSNLYEINLKAKVFKAAK